MKRIAWMSLPALVALLPPGYAQDQRKSNAGFEERRLAVIPENVRLGREAPYFSPDGKTVAYVAQRGRNQLVVVGEKEGEEFETFRYLLFSPDGTTLAYSAQSGRKSFIVVGGKKGELFDTVSDAIFSSDDKTVAYVAMKGPDPRGFLKYFVVVGEHKREEFDDVDAGTLSFSPDGKTVAYSASKDQKHFVVVGEAKGEPCDQVMFGPVFSPDGKTVVYAARNADKQFVVVGGKRSEEFDKVDGLAFTTQGKVIYAARNDPSRHIVVIGDQRIEEHYDPEFMSGSPKFSPNGKTLAYCVSLPNDPSSRYYAVGKKKGECGADFDLVFSPDETTIAYLLSQNGKQFIVVGDQKGEGFDKVGKPVFSPDGKTLAYWAMRIVDFRAKFFIVLRGQRAEEFDFVTDPVFSRDGRKVAFGAVKGREIWRKMIGVK